MRSLSALATSSLLALAVALAPSAAQAQLYNSGSTGALGPLMPVEDTEVVLPDDGVLNYTFVDIPEGVRVTFRRNEDNTPVYVLATEFINVDGTIDVSGASGTDVSGLSAITRLGGVGGPGGSDGGSTNGTTGGSGIGPGPGLGHVGGTHKGGGGASPVNDGKSTGRCCVNAGGGTAYADPGYHFLHGGSGGGGGNTFAGGGGGGVLILAATTSVTINGQILARGGSIWDRAGAGGGGVIRIVSEEISGTGSIDASSRLLGCDGHNEGACGGDGIVRIEAYDISQAAFAILPSSFNSLPLDAVPYAASQRPRLVISQVAGKTPFGGSYFGHQHQSPGVSVPSETTITVEVTANFVPVEQVVNVIVNTIGGGRQIYPSTPLAGTFEQSVATADVDIPANVAIGTIEAWVPNVPIADE